ncbi:hypothetical protein ABBQ32_009042 [Trebouxia sp. C0010 RCD-2024]
MPPTKSSRHLKWQRTFDDALDSDQWGQKIEALRDYEHLRATLQMVLDQNNLELSTHETQGLEAMCVCLELRVKALKTSGKSGISSEDMQRVKAWFADMMTSTETFPVSIPATTAGSSPGLKREVSLREKYQQIYDVPTELVQNVTNVNAADRADTFGYAGSLLPPVSTPLHRGGKLISFKIDKWGFKEDFVKGVQDAFVTISLVDGKGNVMGRPQDTPTTNNLAGNYVLVNCQVHVQQFIDKIPQDSALFFEFKDGRPRKA